MTDEVPETTTRYRHDELCAMKIGAWPSGDMDKCDCVVAILVAKDNRIAVLDRENANLHLDLNLWHSWAVQLEPRLEFMAVEQHLTDDDIRRAE